jgi:hypothetical protein
MRATINNAATATKPKTSRLGFAPTQADCALLCGKAMAERVGFEPTNTREDVTGIPVQRLRPLGHLSNQLLANIFSKASSSRPPRKGANDTPSRLRKCLLWGVEGGRRVEARIGLFPRRGGGCIQSRDVQSIGRVRRIQPGRDLQRGNAGRPHVRLGVVARTPQVSQVLATRETYQDSHNSDQRKAIPHQIPSHGLRPGFIQLNTPAVLSAASTAG